MFTSPQVERYAGPAPVVNEKFQRDIGLCGGCRRDAGFPQVAGDLAPANPAGAILRTNGVRDDIAARQWLKGVQHLDLLITHGVGLEGNGRFHRYQREQLQHMVLDHIANRARFLIIAAAPLNADIFGDGDLDVIDVAPVPYRLEDAVRQAKHQDVLYRLFAEIVVDAINLVFFKDFADLAIEFARRCEIMAEWLLDNETRPALAISVQAGRAEALDNFGILARRRREVKDAITARAALMIEHVQ